MAIDRAATVKKAESLLGEGKLDAAISEYVRLVEDQPSDLSISNTLGDLYVRAGDKDRAAAQFSQVADGQYRQGFVAKASAFYKKALRVKSGDEHSLAQLAAIAAQQELVADAKMYLTQLLKQRRARGDGAGAAECLVRIAALDDENAEAKLAAARAGLGHFDSERVARLFVEAAEGYEKQVKHDEAKAAAQEASQLEVSDPELRRRIAELSAGAAIEAVTEPQVIEPVSEPVSAPVVESPPQFTIELTSQTAEPTAEAAPVADPAPDATIRPAALEVETTSGQTLSFPESEPQAAPHVDLMAILDESPAPVQETISPPVVEDPVVVIYADSASVEEISAEASVSSDSHSPDDSYSLSVSSIADEPKVEIVLPPPAPIVRPAPVAPPAPPAARAVSPDAKARFDELLARSTRRTQPPQAPASQATDQGASARDGDADGVAQLEAAARTPALQFQASAQLGRLFIARGDLRKGVEWLERATQAPIQIPEHAIAVLYEMADALERMGETARTLEVLHELEANAGTYRDVSERIARLTKMQSEGCEP